MANKRKLYIIGKKRIGGRWCDEFWKLDSEGKTGYDFWRFPTPKEIEQMLKDIATQRKLARQELNELKEAEKILLKLKTNL